MLVSICMPVCTCVERRGGWVVIVTVTSHPEFSRKYTTDTDSGVKGAVQQKRKEKEDRYRTIQSHQANELLRLIGRRRRYSSFPLA